MVAKHSVLPSLLTLLALAAAGCSESKVVVTDAQLQPLKTPAKVIPADTPSSPEKIALGERLYSDARMSREGKVSCATCHGLDNFGVDSLKTSTGTGGLVGDRNSPSSFNAFRQFAQFWDGREATVEDQAVGPILNPIEHGIKDAAEVAAILKKDAELVAAFGKAFPGESDPVTLANVGRAIGAFERTIVTKSRFDDFLGGDHAALSNAEKQGLIDFVDIGCTTCHTSDMVGGQMYQKLGNVHAYESKDLGKYEETKKEEHKYFFKVPSLLNIEKTGPYFHDGSIADLNEAIRLMAWHQLGKKLDDAKVKSIRTFLASLTGEWKRK